MYFSFDQTLATKLSVPRQQTLAGFRLRSGGRWRPAAAGHEERGRGRHPGPAQRGVAAALSALATEDAAAAHTAPADALVDSASDHRAGEHLARFVVIVVVGAEIDLFHFSVGDKIIGP